MLTFNPQVLNGLSEDVTLIVNRVPENAEITIKIFEVGPDDRNDPPGNSLVLAVIKGTAQNLRLVSTTIQQSAGPILRLRLPGNNPVAEIRLPERADCVRLETGVYEVMAAITGGAESESSPILFIRRFRKGGPHIAIITGNTDFHVAASDYLEPMVDAILSCQGRVERFSNICFDNLTDIVQFLEEAPDRYGYGPWEEVNIVAHGGPIQDGGNDYQIYLRPTAQSAPTERLSARNLEVFPRRVSPERLPSGSRLIFRGCVVGRDQSLLNALCGVFGGQTKVYAPKHIIGYNSLGSSPFEYFVVESPACVMPTTRADQLNQAECLRRLREVDQAGLFTEEERRDAWQTRKVSPVTYRYPINPYRTRSVVRRGPNNRTPAMMAALDRWEKLEPEFNSLPGHWVWSPDVEVLSERIDPDDPTIRMYHLELLGRGTRVALRKKLLDENGSLVVPDLSNPDHFGTSATPGR